MSKLPWNGPLFPVSGHLAERYASALKQVSDKETSLTQFTVDRLGWSPQLAGVLGEDYLGEGALRYAIILSPDQAAAPIVRRRFSYEAQIIERVYLEARATLLHLIEHEPAIVEIDNGQAFCRTAADVASITAVDACLTSPRNTLSKTSELLQLAQGLREHSRLMDEAYIDRMLALVTDVGDPRKRPLPPELRMNILSLWANIGDGVYILRKPTMRKRDTLAITATNEPALAHLPVTAFQMGDPTLVDALHDNEWLRYVADEPTIQKRLAELEREALLQAGEAQPGTTAAERRRQLARRTQAQNSLPPVYWELDSALKRIQAGGRADPKQLSPAARWALSTPTRDADVVTHLLTRFVPYDYQMFTHHHRRRTENKWGSYSEAKQRYLEANFPYLTQGFVVPAATTEQPTAAGTTPA